MGENKTPDLPVQIIKANGGPPLAVVPLPVLLVLADFARKEMDRIKTKVDFDRAMSDALKKTAGEHGIPVAEGWSSDLKRFAEDTSIALKIFLSYRDDYDNELAAYNEAKARDEEALPLAVVKRLAAGEHPVKVFREHRRLTQAELAEAAGTTPAYLSQIETGKRGGSKKLLRSLAEALEVELADLLE